VTPSHRSVGVTVILALGAYASTMSVDRMRYIVLASAAWLPIASLAAPSPSPLDPTAPVPPLTYVSSIAGYRAFGEVEVKTWPQVNETVRSVGGHAGTLSTAPHSPGSHGTTPPGANPASPQRPTQSSRP
jgi:hypothetical protein